MRINEDPALPILGTPTYQEELNFQLYQKLRDIAFQLNAISEGYIYGATNASTSAPTTGTYSQGDYVRNSAPSELGSASSKYVILGWVCTVGGEPGTWVECRVLTGN